MKPKRYYALFADLAGRPCVVVGGGIVAQRKVARLLHCGAQVTVISPDMTARLRALARTGAIRHVARRFRPADLRGAWLVFAATDEAAINQSVYRTASRARIFANVVDRPALCSFIAPSIFTRGALTVAVSTGGASPTVAKRLRRVLGRTIGAEYVPMLRLLSNLRGMAKQQLPSYNDRKRYFDQLVQGRVFELVRAKRVPQARKEAMRLLDKHATRNGLRAPV